MSCYIDLYHNYYTIAYNTTYVKPADVQAKWEHLLDAKWAEGKISLDPLSYDWYFGMRTTWGTQKTNDFMKKLNSNKPAFRDGNVLIANLLAAGEFPLAVTDAHLIEQLRGRGAPVDWMPIRPMVAVPVSVALPLHSPNPGAAGLFIDLILSKEVAELLKTMGRVPTRADVSPSAKRLDPKSLDLVPLHVSSDENGPGGVSKTLWPSIKRRNAAAGTVAHIGVTAALEQTTGRQIRRSQTLEVGERRSRLVPLVLCKS